MFVLGQEMMAIGEVMHVDFGTWVKVHVHNVLYTDEMQSMLQRTLQVKAGNIAVLHFTSYKLSISGSKQTTMPLTRTVGGARTPLTRTVGVPGHL